MKVVSVLGSPRKKGNTAAVLGWIEEELKRLGHDVERIDAAAQSVKGCLGCYTCQKKLDEPGCVQKDDALQIFDKMIKADAIVYSSPLYCWSWSGQIKPLIDRHFCLVKNGYGDGWTSLIEGKKAALVVTSGGGLENNADLLIKAYENLASYCKCRPAGVLHVGFAQTPKDLHEDVKKQAAQLARDIVG
jgi:multimeric flavodoxin WrbA